MVSTGKTINYVCSHLKISRLTMRLKYHQYQLGGELALLSPTNQAHLPLDRKIAIVEDIIKNGLSLLSASLKYNVPHDTLRCWVIRYRENGVSGLEHKRHLNDMKKKRQRTEAEMDELEMLRKRNEYLEAENALLKKVKALVEEREARLRAIGRKPSKD